MSETTNLNRAARRKLSREANKQKKSLMMQSPPFSTPLMNSEQDLMNSEGNMSNMHQHLDMSQLPPEVAKQIAEMSQNQNQNTENATNGLNLHTLTSGASARDKKPGGRNYKYEVLKTELMALYGGAGMLVMGFQPADGMVIMTHAEQIADAWVTLAKGNESVYKVLKSVCGASAIGTVVALHASMLNAIMANHGVTLGSMLKRKPDGNDNISEFPGPNAA